MLVKLLGNQEVSQVECFVIHSIGSLGSFCRNRVVGKGEAGFKEKVKSVGISKSIILEMPAFLIVHIEALSPGCISDNRVFISICASAAAAFIEVAT